MSPEHQARIKELEGVIAALRSGAIDALVIDTDDGPCVRTVDGGEAIYHRLVERLPEGIVALSLDGTILFASKRFGALVGAPSEELVGRPFIELVAHSDRERIAAAIDDHGPEDVHRLAELSAGTLRDVSASLSIEGIERPGQTARWVIATDIDHQAHLRYLAEHDHLTGLLNRRGFDFRLEIHHGSAAAGGALLLVDIDHFKTVNDRLGHATGDRLLTQVAHGLAASLRGNDVIGRVGGDEFAILVPSGDYSAVGALVSRLLACIRSLEIGDATKLGRHVTVSIGGAFFTTDGDAMVAADNALYRAKQAGRDRAVVSGGAQHTVA